MNEQLTPDVVDTLVCELGQRPKGAPSIGDIVGSVTSVHREVDSLVVTFDATAIEVVQAVVEAERQCCSTLGWHLELEHGVQLRIVATPRQLDTLEAMFSSAATVEM